MFPGWEIFTASGWSYRAGCLKNKLMDFVWPYIYGPSFYRKAGIFYELDFSIRSVRKNYQGEARCIVVGDDPNLDVIHIPVQRIETHKSNPREVDVINKITQYINADPGDEFIFMCDDLFILQPVDDEELKKAYARSEVTSIFDYLKGRRGSMDYKRAWRATYEFAMTIRYPKGLKTYDWECHLPRYMKTERVKYILENFDLKENPKLLTGLHDGYEVEETEMITSDLHADLWSHYPGMDFDKELSKKYMNLYDDAIMPELIEKMENMFG